MLTAAAIKTAMTAAATLGLRRIRAHPASLPRPASTAAAEASLVTRVARASSVS
jgi:hypothetical protein